MVEIEMEGVGKSFGGTVVFRDFSAHLQPGGVTAVRGANGSGKSTLLRLAAKLLSPDTGKVVARDREAGLVLEKAEAGYRIGLHSEIMELRSRRDAAGTYEWTWQRTGTPDETGDDYAGDAYHVIRNGLRALCYRDGKLALASRDPSGLQDIFLEVYGDGGMLYGALLENGLESQAYTQSYYLTTPWQGDPLTLTWGEE